MLIGCSGQISVIIHIGGLAGRAKSRRVSGTRRA